MGQQSASTLGQVAEFFGMSESAVKTWRAAGMPGDPGSYDLAEVSQWLRTYGPWRDRGTAPAPEDSPALERQREEQYKIKRLERLALEQQLIPAAGVERCLTLLVERLEQFAEEVHEAFGTEAKALTTELIRDVQRQSATSVESGPQNGP